MEIAGILVLQDLYFFRFGSLAYRCHSTTSIIITVTLMYQPWIFLNFLI